MSHSSSGCSAPAWWLPASQWWYEGKHCHCWEAQQPASGWSGGAADSSGANWENSQTCWARAAGCYGEGAATALTGEMLQLHLALSFSIIVNLLRIAMMKSYIKCIQPEHQFAKPKEEAGSWCFPASDWSGGSSAGMQKCWGKGQEGHYWCCHDGRGAEERAGHQRSPGAYEEEHGANH